MINYLSLQTTQIMKIYIDNNILIDYEKHRIELPTDNITYFYSIVHLQELIELGDRFYDLKDKRLETIYKLTNGHFIMDDDYQHLQRYIVDPNKMLISCMNPISMNIRESQKMKLKTFATDEKRDTIIKEMGVDVRRLNNYTVSEIAKQFGPLIYYYINNTSDTQQNVFSSFFNILDLIGSWRDKLTEKSNMARAYDARHAYHATICDYFVTNDIRTLHKANVVYQTYGYKTRAINYFDFLKLATKDCER